MSTFTKVMWAIVVIAASLPIIVYSIRYLFYGFNPNDNIAGITIAAYIVIGFGLVGKKIFEDIF